MEEKKLDLNSIIGFVLIFGILAFMLWQNKPTPEELEAQEKAKQEQIAAENKANTPSDAKVVTADDFKVTGVSDSLQLIELKSKFGAFAYAASTASDKETLVESDVFALKFSNKGGYLSELELKKFVNYDSLPIYLIKNNNAGFNINFGTTDSRILNTKDLYFTPSITKNGENTVVSMKLKVSESKFLEYRYEIKPGDYMMDFTVRSQGLSDVINGSQAINLDWALKGYRHAKSISYENRYTDIHYEYEDGKANYTGARDADEELEDHWHYKQVKLISLWIYILVQMILML